MRVLTRFFAFLLLIVAVTSCSDTESRDRNVTVLTGLTCAKPGKVDSRGRITNVCGRTPIGNIWYATSRSKGKTAMCRTLGKIRFKAKVVWVCGSSKGSGRWIPTKPLPALSTSVTATTTPSNPPQPDAFANSFTPSTISPSTTAAVPVNGVDSLPAGGFTTAQDAPSEPNTGPLAEPNDDPLPQPRVADLTGPQIESIDVSPSTVGPGDRFTVTIVTSDPSGVNRASMIFMLGRAQRDFCGQSLDLISGDALKGTWQTQCTAPSVGSNGNYVVVPSAADLVGNYTNTNCCTRSSLRGNFTLVGAREDSEGPLFSNLTLSKKNLTPGDSFVMNVNTTDASGVEWMQFSFRLGSQQIDFCDGTMRRTSGTSQNGQWTATCKVPDLVRNGTYSVKLYAADTADNFTNTNCCTKSDVTDSFTVTGGTNDASGPAISSITIDKSPVRPGDLVRITVVMSDPSGIAWNGITSSINGAQRDICGQSLARGSTSGIESTWYTNCEIPITAQPGRYEFRAYATDLLNNSTNTNCCDRSSLRAYLDVE